VCRVDARHCLIRHTVFQNVVYCGRNSAVGIATRKGLIGSGIEIPWGPEFPYPARPAPRATQLPCTCTYTGSPSPVVKRPTHGYDRPPHLAPRLKKEYGCNSIPPYAIMSCYGENLASQIVLPADRKFTSLFKIALDVSII
jgi:hypothetical protein